MMLFLLISSNLYVGSQIFTEIYRLESLVKRLKEIHNEFEMMKLYEPHIELNS